MIQADPLPTRVRSAPAPSDRRRAARRRITGVTGTRRSPGDLTVLDLSLTGLAAEAIGEIAPGERCFVELVHQGHRVHVEAVVRWASVTRVERSADRFIPVFRAGLSFVAIDRDESGGIWDWILPEPSPASPAVS
jgi:hypothetical protein